MKLLTAEQAAQIFNKDAAYFNRHIKVQPDFPKAIRVAPKARPQWRDVDIFSYIERLAA